MFVIPFVDAIGYGGRDTSDVMELVHTQWLITDEDNIQWKIRFLSEGRFEYTDPVFLDWEYWDTNPWCDNGRWKCEKRRHVREYIKNTNAGFQRVSRVSRRRPRGGLRRP